jgi:two-component system NtrC family sensor kinase
MTQATAVLLIAVALVAPDAWVADRTPALEMLHVLGAVGLVLAALIIRRGAQGVHRPLLAGIAWTWASSSLHHVVVASDVAGPGLTEVLRTVTGTGVSGGMIIGCAAALGWRRRAVWRDLAVDVAMLVLAAIVLGICLGIFWPPPPIVHGAGAAGGPAVAFYRRSLSAAALLIVALLIALRGARVGRTASIGILLGTLVFAVAGEWSTGPNSALLRAVCWPIALFALSAAVRAMASTAAAGGPTAAGPSTDPTTLEPAGAARVRARFLLGATGIVAVATFVLAFRMNSSPALAIAVSAFVVMIAVRASGLLGQQGEQAVRLARSVEAERALSATLESRVAERTSELAEAERVLQRMWMLGQHITLELHPARVLARFMEAVLDVAGAEGGVLGLVADDNRIRIAAAAGSPSFPTDAVIEADATAMSGVIQSGRTLSVEDLREVPDLPIPRSVRHQRALVIVPLVRRGECIGAVELHSSEPHAFTEADVARVEAMTDMMSVALANAELVENLRQAELRFRTLFRAAPDAVLTVQLGGRVQDANDYVREITGLEPGQVVGRDLIEFVAAKDERPLRDALTAAFAGLPARLEVDFRRKSMPSEVRCVALAARRLPETDPPTLLLIGRDMTGEREMRARLMETERLAAVGELVAGVAHEVNNPLSSISAFAQLLQRDSDLSLAQRESIDVIRAETARASQVVRDLLAFARRSAPQREPLDLNQLLERTLRLRNYELRSNNVQLSLALSPSLPAVIADARQLQQVVLNLVTNAIQAMAGDGGGTLLVMTRADGSRVVLEVNDSGPGIPAALRARVFEPFFTTKPEGEGTGLGLSVSYGIITAHGGTIALAEPTDGATGARFVVSLPGIDERAAPRPSGELPAVAVRSGLAGLRVLFVDDEAAIRSGFEAFGRLRGFQVISAGDGRAALDALQRTSVDAVVSDLRMPGMDGVALYHALHDDLPGLAARTVFITGDLVTMGGGAAQRLRQPVLTKPFSFERLEQTLIAVVRGGGAVEGLGVGGRGDGPA